MITLEELKHQVGTERWDSARREAWESAPGTGTFIQRERQADKREDAFEQVRSLLDQSTHFDDPDMALVDIYTQVYRIMPSYGLLFDLSIKRPYDEMSAEARAVFWAFAKEMLASPEDALADPVAYVMWCDFFEDPARVDEAWQMLVSAESGSHMLRRILAASGPVPFRLKQPLYDRLITDDLWHDSIFQSLLFSCSDVYGDFNREAAALVYSKLTLRSVEKGDIERLEAALSGKSS